MMMMVNFVFYSSSECLCMLFYFVVRYSVEVVVMVVVRMSRVKGLRVMGDGGIGVGVFFVRVVR